MIFITKNSNKYCSLLQKFNRYAVMVAYVVIRYNSLTATRYWSRILFIATIV